AAVQSLPLGEAQARGGLGERGGQALVALQADDLFGEVVRVGEVGPPGRDGDGQFVLSDDIAAAVLEPPYDGLAAVDDARDLVRVVGGDGDGVRRGGRD